MKNIRKLFVPAALCILLSAYLISLVYYLIGLNNSVSNYKADPENSLSMGYLRDWKYIPGDSPKDQAGSFVRVKENSGEGWIPYRFPGKPANTFGERNIWVKAVLPEGGWAEPALRFRAPQQSVEIYLDSKLIYSYGKIDRSNVTKTPGSIWHIVTLPRDFQGKTVYFRLYSPFPNYAGYLADAQVGPRSTHILNIFEENLLSFVLAGLFIFLAAVIFIVYLFGSKLWGPVLYLSLGSICIGFWYMTGGEFFDHIIYAPILSIYFSHFSIYLVPVCFILYIQYVFTKERSWEETLLKRLWQVLLPLVLLLFTLDLTGISSIFYFDQALDVITIAALLPALYVLPKAVIHGRADAGILTGGLFVLILTRLFEIYSKINMQPPLLGPVNVSFWGMLLFILLIVIMLGRRATTLYNLLREKTAESDTNYRSLFGNMSEGFLYCRVSPDNNALEDCMILEANQAALEALCLERPQVIGEKLRRVFPEIAAGFLIEGELADQVGNKSWKDCKFHGGGHEEASMAEIYTALGIEAAAAKDAAVIEEHSSDGLVRTGFNESMKVVSLHGKWFKLSAFSPKEGYSSIILSDITEMKNAEQILRHQAYFDNMTGFYNRTYFEDTMAEMSKRLDELNPISILAIDIDGLKITNDTLGHKTGDNLIVETSRMVSQIFASEGILNRIGGDEFCVILPRTDKKTAQNKVDELIRLVNQANASKPVPISMSIGVAAYGEEEGEDLYNVYRRADDDMYRYKMSQTKSEKSKVIDMLLTALSEKDYVSQGHVERLVRMAECMADELGLQETEKRNLVLLTKVHDLGKIGIPDDILNKPGKLTDSEYDRMKQHVRIGYNIASRSKELANVAKLILHHHEHWDGRGYPDGLKRDAIPLECRILGVLDAFDAMTNERPYHKGVSKEEALLEIKRCSGSQFDPVVAIKFNEVVSGFRY